jgi:hypothetical protein
MVSLGLTLNGRRGLKDFFQACVDSTISRLYVTMLCYSCYAILVMSSSKFLISSQ